MSVVAAATKYEDDSEDNDPGAVIIEKMAKTVVVHSMFLRRMIAMLHRSFIYYAVGRIRDTAPEILIKKLTVMGAKGKNIC